MLITESKFCLRNERNFLLSHSLQSHASDISWMMLVVVASQLNMFKSSFELLNLQKCQFIIKFFSFTMIWIWNFAEISSYSSKTSIWTHFLQKWKTRRKFDELWMSNIEKLIMWHKSKINAIWVISIIVLMHFDHTVKINTMIIEIMMMLWEQTMMLSEHILFIKTFRRREINFLLSINFAIFFFKIVLINFNSNNNVLFFRNNNNMMNIKIIKKEFKVNHSRSY